MTAPTCSCGSWPLVEVPGGYLMCPHDDTGDCADVLAAHPSMECVDCLRLGTNWDARFESETP